MKKIYIIMFSIIIIIGISILLINHVNANHKEVTISETISLMDDMPATDYERDIEKTRDLLNIYKNGNLEDTSKLATIKNASKDISSTRTINSEEENAKIKLSSCYRAYKKGTLNYDILCSSIESDISAINIDLEGVKIYKKDDNNLIQKLENCITICETYLEKAKEQKISDSKGVYELYEEYDKKYTYLKNEINELL